MSSAPSAQVKPTELELDYKDISTGQLVIVIHGLPTTVADSRAPAAGDVRLVALPPASGNPQHGSPSSPLVEEARTLSDAAAYAPVLVTSLVLAAWRGQEARALELTAAMIEDAPPREKLRATAIADYAGAVLYNGLGRYQEALLHAERACVHEDLGSYPWALPELVEAAARSNVRAVAAEALGRLERWTRAARTDWALGVHARSAALVSDGDRTEDLYREAVDLLGRSGIAVQLARAQLLYGEWLRRENRRVDARVHLRAADETFNRIAADAFAERAFRELLATGETARKRTDDTRGHLTPQEAHIARLARDGLSNPEIGAQLFISPRTVQYHLRKVFQKLEITSRNQLGRIAPGRLGVAHGGLA